MEIFNKYNLKLNWFTQYSGLKNEINEIIFVHKWKL